MEKHEEEVNVKILLDKAKLYLSFSLAFMAISFPLILLLSEPIVNLLMITSILLFTISIIITIYTFNSLNSLKIQNDKEFVKKGISFYSYFIVVSNYLNVIGFFLFVLYLSVIITQSIFIMCYYAVIIIFSLISFRLLKKYHFESKNLKRLAFFVILVFILLVIIGSLISISA